MAALDQLSCWRELSSSFVFPFLESELNILKCQKKLPVVSCMTTCGLLQLVSFVKSYWWLFSFWQIWQIHVHFKTEKFNWGSGQKGKEESQVFLQMANKTGYLFTIFFFFDLINVTMDTMDKICSSLQWRIRISQTGVGGNPWVWAEQLLFCRKLNENEKKLNRGRAHPWHPLGSTNSPRELWNQVSSHNREMLNMLSLFAKDLCTLNKIVRSRLWAVFASCVLCLCSAFCVMLGVKMLGVPRSAWKC